ncbi:MAG: hypothetical protein ACRCX2_37905 [Paraclostridium sp.]
MLYKYEFSNEEEREIIISKNTDKYLICEDRIIEGNFLIYSDIKTVEILQEEQAYKISILEAENATLKEKINVTQDAVNELILNSMSL